MKYYFDITLLPDLEIPLYFLWEKIYLQVHLALVEMKDSNGSMSIGVSFPKYKSKVYKHPLGNMLRVFSRDRASLEKLGISKWLSRFDDYLLLSGINNVPESIKTFACFKRERVKTNNERIARRKAMREGITFEEAYLIIKGRKPVVRDLPFVNIQSLSSGNHFSLKIDYKSEEQETLGSFDSYGLSSKSTVPIF